MRRKQSWWFEGVVWFMVFLAAEMGFPQVASTPVAADSVWPGELSRTDSQPTVQKGAEGAASSTEADPADPFIVEVAQLVGPGTQAAFELVRDRIGYECYTGSLRGARGALWSQAGNSLDRASLLIALLRAQGTPAHYVRGSLTDADARELIGSMFDPVVAASAVGYVPPQFPRSDPLKDPQMLSIARDHWWVELDSGTQLDPSFAGATIGSVRGAKIASFPELPEEVRHKVVVRLKTEFHNPLSQFSEQTPLEATFTTSEIYGKPLTLGQFVNVNQPPSMFIGYKTYTYSPYLMVDDNDMSLENNHIILGKDYQEFYTTGFAIANMTLTRATLEFEVRAPGKEPTFHARDLLDRVGIAARHGMGQPGPVDTSQPVMTEFDMATASVLPGWVFPRVLATQAEAITNLQAQVEVLAPEVERISRGPGTTQLSGGEMATVTRYTALLRLLQAANTQFLNTSFLIDSDYWAQHTGKAHEVRAWYDSPRLILTQTRITATAGSTNATARLSLDIRKDDMRAVPYPGQNARADFSFNMVRGYRRSIVEHEVVKAVVNTNKLDALSAPSAVAVFIAAKQQNVPIEVLQGPADVQKLEQFPISAEAKARITLALLENRAVNLPARMVEIGGVPAIGWFEVDPETGELHSVSEDGGRQEAAEFALIIALVFFTSVIALAIFGKTIKDCISGSSTSIANTSKKFKIIDNKTEPITVPPAVMSSTATSIAEGTRVTVKSIVDSGDGTYTITTEDRVLTIPKIEDLNQGVIATGSSGSVVRWAGQHLEVCNLFNLGPSGITNSLLKGSDFSLELVGEPGLSVAVGDASLPSAFRARISYIGTNAPSSISGFDTKIGQAFLFRLTGNVSGLLWGTDIYDRDSSLATAAVHAGVLTNGQTGTVKVRVLGAQSSYIGSTRNGVTSLSYSGTGLSYRFEPLDPNSDGTEFVLSGNAPSGWNLLFARTNSFVPAGVTGDLSVYLQPQNMAALAGPGTVVPFTLKVAHADNLSLSVTQQVSFTMPQVQDVNLAATRETIYISPNGTTTLDITTLNTGNVTQQVALAFSLPTNFTASGSSMSFALPPAASKTQTVSIVAAGAALDSISYGSIQAVYGGTNQLGKRVQIKLQVAAPGALQALYSANDAKSLGRGELATTLETLGAQLSRLYAEPASELYRSGALAGIRSLIQQLDDPLLRPFIALLQDASNQLFGAANNQAVLAALESLGVALTPLRDRLLLMAETDFELALSPSSATALPETATTFGIYLKNKGRQTTFYTLNLSSLPAGITGGLDRTNIALAPGEAISPTMGTNRINVVLTQPAQELSSFAFTITATADGAPQITRMAEGAFTARPELIQITQVEVDPPIIDAAANGVRLFTGPGPGEGLDLDGTFQYAINFGGASAPGNIRDASFTTTNAPGVVVQYRHADGAWYAPDFGTSSSDNILENIMRSIVWSEYSIPLAVRLGNLEPERAYKLQLLLNEPRSTTLKFDISANGQMLAEAFCPGDLKGGALSVTNAVVLTHEFTATNSTLDIVLDGRRYRSSDTPTLCGLTLESSPRAMPHVRARVLNAVNKDREILLQYTLKDQQGRVMAASGPLHERVTVLSSLDTFDLGEISAAGLGAGSYIVEVSASEIDGTASRIATGTLLVGSPVQVNIATSPTSVPPGNSRVNVAVNISNQLNPAADTLPLVGLVDTPGNAIRLALHGNYAYVGASDCLVSVVDLSDIRNPRFIRNITSCEDQFIALMGTNLVAGDERWGSLHVYSLTNPAAPVRIGQAFSGVNDALRSTFPDSLITEGNYALFQTIVYGWSGDTMSFVRGDVLMFDVSNPKAPGYRGLLYNTPHTQSPQNVGSDYVINAPAALGDGVVLLPSSTAKDAAVGGTGLLRILETSGVTNPVVSGEFQVPGTALLYAAAVHGDRALVLGNTAGMAVVDGPNMPGMTTLTLLDVSNPRSPVILSTNVAVPNIDVVQRRSMKLYGGEDDIYLLSGVMSNNVPFLVLVNTRDPQNIVVRWLSAPSQVASGAVTNGLLYTVSSSGLAIYDLGGWLGMPVRAEVRIPTVSGVKLVPGSFNAPADQISTNSDYQALVWNRTLSAAVTNLAFSWQMDVEGVEPGTAREVTSGGAVDYSALGVSFSSVLPPSSVACDHILSMEPASNSVAPGGIAAFTLRIKNPGSNSVAYAISLKGVCGDWVSVASPVTVSTQSEKLVPLQIKSDSSAPQRPYLFSVEAKAADASLHDSVLATLTLVGLPEVADESPGVVVDLKPSTAVAGQGTAARFTVRLTNTGNVTDQFGITVDAPSALMQFVAEPIIEVPPGLENYRETEVRIVPRPGTPAGQTGFKVSASSLRWSAIRDDASAVVDVAGVGVAMGFSPASGPPDSRFQLSVTNTGQQTTTFDLSLGGTAAGAAKLGQAALSLSPGAVQTVDVDVSKIDYAYVGPASLLGVATARGWTNVQAQAAATVEVPVLHGLSASFEPARVGIPAPGPATASLVVRNAGNGEEILTARILSTSGPLTAALQRFHGQPLQPTNTVRLPGLSTGVLPLEAMMTAHGTGAVQVLVSSLTTSNLSATATVYFRSGVWLSYSREPIIALSYLPEPERNYFLEYAPNLQPGFTWAEMPGGPHNRGLYYFCTLENCGSFTVDPSDPGNPFFDAATLPSRYFRLRSVQGVAPSLKMNYVHAPTLRFDPLPGYDHTVQQSDTVGAGANWQALPLAPHNGGLVFDPEPPSTRFYRVLITSAQE